MKLYHGTTAQSVDKQVTVQRMDQDEDGFDEVVIGDWLHIERMSVGKPHEFWVRIGSGRCCTFFVQVDDKGAVTFTPQAGMIRTGEEGDG